MSRRFERLYRRTWERHRKVISAEISMRGGEQECLNVLANSITDLNAVVAKLIDAEVKRRTRKRRPPSPVSPKEPV